MKIDFLNRLRKRIRSEIMVGIFFGILIGIIISAVVIAVYRLYPNILIDTIIAPIIVAAISYFYISRFDEFRKHKRDSIIGVAILDSLIEELNTGITIMTKSFDEKENYYPRNLPKASWSGTGTIPDDVLIRILTISKDKDLVGYPFKEIRIHTKNYFEFMTFNWNNIVAEHKKDANIILRRNYGNYLLCATRVRDMLSRLKELLEENAQKAWSD